MNCTCKKTDEVLPTSKHQETFLVKWEYLADRTFPLAFNFGRKNGPDHKHRELFN